MAGLRHFDPPSEIRGELYRAVLDVAVQQALPTALLVVHDHMRLDDSGQALLDRLAPSLLARDTAAEWPGTRLAGHTATVLRYRLDAEVASRLVDAATGLFDWIQPGLPEDPCILRPDGTPWLTTIAHERDAFFTLTGDERDRLVRAIPALAPLAPPPA